MARISILSIAAVAFCGVAYGAKTNYVDCSLGNYEGHDGSSWEKAFKTIQEGVDNAETDDVVLVAPGWYDEGGEATANNGVTNRVYITKCITVRSRDGRATRDSTFIVGSHSKDPGSLGLGSDAVRCVRFATEGSYGAILEGFTLINGATHSGSDGVNTRGGGVCFEKDTNNSGNKFTGIVDCVVSNCVAERGGGMYFGNAVRSRFTGNTANANSAAVRAANMYWCIVDANPSAGKAGQVRLDACRMVNCTLANSDARAFSGQSKDHLCSAYNTVALSYVSDSSCTYVELANCVVPENVNFYYGSGKDSDTGVSHDNCRYVAMNSYQFVSTATGDLRPVSGGDLIGAGDAKYLELIPEKYRNTDYEGEEVLQAGTITAGAITTPVEIKGGMVRYVSSYKNADKPGVKVNGYVHFIDGLYSHCVSETPTPCAVECTMPTKQSDSRLFYAFSAYCTNTVLGGKDSTMLHPPLRETTLAHLFVPSVAGVELKVTPIVSDRLFWADPSVADDEEMDGSEEKPYNTLQGAVDAACSAGGKKFYAIMAKAGRYDKGGVFFGGVTNRVAFTSDTARLKLYAVDGPEKTFIVGAGDQGSGNQYGYGSNAVRCVASNTGISSVSGFTLTDGRTSLNDVGQEADVAACRGGAIYTSHGFFTVEDCIITNCVASRGGIAYGGILRRCRAVDCQASGNGAMRGGVCASACVFDSIRNSHIVGQDEKVYNCTFVGSADNCAKLTNSKAVTEGSGVHNSVVYGFNVLEGATGYIFGGVYYDKVNGIADEVTAISGLRKEDIYFADSEAKDYRLYSVSRCKDRGATEQLDSEFWRYGSAVDIEGNPYNFRTDGTVEVGAYAKSVPSMLIEATVPENVARVSVSPAGKTVLAEGETVVFTANDAGTRNFQGFYLDGEDDPITTEPTFTYTYSTENNGGHLNLVAKYVPYWYVDPSKSDGNSGRSWGEAKKSLAEVMKLAIPGDTVYAEEGVYAIGDMIQHANSFSVAIQPLLRARVVITNGVSLVSRRGPERTVIMGAEAKNPDQFGCGADALRCVYMYPDTRLEGFTLAGGRDRGEDLQDDNNRGAGVHGWKDALSLVKDCIISNNVASRGGGATHVTTVNCRYFHNRGYVNSAATQHCFHHNCYFDYNVSGTGDAGSYVVGYWREMRSCTFGAHNFLNDKQYAIGPSPDNKVQHPQVYNTLVLKGGMYVTESEVVQAVFTNCAFTTAARDAWPANNNSPYDGATIFADPSQLQADENGVPIPGKNIAIDQGDMQYVDPLYAATDLAGNPRAVNGSMMDIGCYEADWKARYASDLGSRLSVVEASPAVYETDSRTVALVNDTKVTLNLGGISGRTVRQAVSFKVTGEGVLTLKINGVEHVYEASEAVQTFMNTTAAASTEYAFSFAGDGVAELLNCSNGIGMSLVIR